MGKKQGEILFSLKKKSKKNFSVTFSFSEKFCSAGKIAKLSPSPSSSWAELALFSAIPRPTRPVQLELHFHYKLVLRIESKCHLEWSEDP